MGTNNHRLDKVCETILVEHEFLDELASKAPTPGGGGASAYCGALASALASMVGNLTVGKKAYEHVESKMQSVLFELSEVRNRLLELIDEDARAFLPLSQAFKLPKTTSEEAAYKERLMQEALIPATEAPLEIMHECARVIELSAFTAHNGSRFAISDAGVAAVFAKASLKGASLNVYNNITLITDEKRALRYTQQADELIEKYSVLADETYAYVRAKIG